ncbi:MAG TPA: IS110 family transposase [Anaerolineae bacterium]|nr:IS110 family transposase [Anaerolineae bacterium]
MILGIDIAKKKFDVALYEGKSLVSSGQFDNTPAGFKKLSRWLKKKKAGVVWACMEATGRYGDNLALYLHEAGYRVSVVNPARIKKYAESKLRRNKTDKLDAQVIADFCRTQEPALWTPPAPGKRELQEMVRRLNALIKERTRETNRLKSGISSEFVKESIKANLEFLNEQIAKLEEQIPIHVNQYPKLKKERDLLSSIKGIGDKTAAILLGELPEIDNFDNVCQVLAYAGVSPSQHESGSSVHKRTKLTKTGNKNVKTALYFPALSAIRFNPIVNALALRLKEKGKEKMVIVGAAMRKLLQLAYGVLKSNQPFDPHYTAKSQSAI